MHRHDTHRRLCLTLFVLFFHQIFFHNSAKYFCTCNLMNTRKYTRIFQRKQYGFCHFCGSSLNLVPEIMDAYNAAFEVVCITIYAPIIDAFGRAKQRQLAFDKRWHVVCSVLLFDIPVVRARTIALVFIHYFLFFTDNNPTHRH